MKIKILVYFIILFTNINLFGQEICDCNGDFNFVVNSIEEQHPGFSLNVTENNFLQYITLKDSLALETQKQNFDKEICQKNIKKYLNFFKDKHLQIYDPIKIRVADYENNFVAKNLPKYKELENSTSYIKIPSFNYKLWKELDNFYDSISPIIKNKEKIILDIRNNGGGGERMYKQLLKILKSNSKKAKIAVVLNRKCASACEEVALILSENKYITTFGENTNGQFAYGFVKGIKTPNCGFTFVTTTKKYPDRLKYEYVGIKPEIILEKENESEWINIIQEMLNK
jgi:hypothetical protein